MGAGTLSQKALFAAKIEDDEGTGETLAAADLLPVVATLFPSLEQDSNSRDLLRGTLTMPDDIAGTKGGTIGPQVELAGVKASSWPAPPPWSILLRSGGFKQVRPTLGSQCGRITIGASWSTGKKLASGTVVTFGATSSATAKVYGDYYEGDTAIFYELLSGTPVAGDNQLTATGIDIPISGAGNAADEAYIFHPYGCEVSTISLSAVASGPISVGDELLGGTSGARAYATKATSGSGAQFLEYELFEDSGNFVSGETISVVGGSATGTADAAPTQLDVPSLTVGHWDTQHTRLKGARCSPSLRLANGDRGIWTFAFDGIGIQPADASAPVWPGDPDAKPPTVVGSRLELLYYTGGAIANTWLPLFKEASFSIENELTRVDFPGDTSTAGFKSTKIVKRNVSGTLDPRAVKEAVFPIMGNAWNKNPCRFSGRVGSSAGDGNTIEYQAPSVLFQSPSKDNDGGLVRNTIPFQCRGLGDDEIFIFVW